MYLKAIVTGVGRSGTTYLAKLITSMGLKCGHESVFDYSSDEKIKERITNPKKRVISAVSSRKSPNWIDPMETEAESSYISAPYLNWPELSDSKVIHVFRNPIKVAKSFILDFNYFSKKEPNKKNPFNNLGFEEKIWRFLPELSNIKTQEERFCYFYTNWNYLAKNNYKDKENIVVNIEEKNLVEKISKFLNLNYDANKLFNNKKENTFDRNKKFTLSAIPEGNIKKDFLKLTKKILRHEKHL